jgi:serine/threonine protein kinase
MIELAADAWLHSGQYADIAGLKLRPIENTLLKNPLLKGIPLAVMRGQAQSFYLTDDKNFDWVLKKFPTTRSPNDTHLKAIQPLVPHRPGFQSGYLRQVLTRTDVSASGFFSTDFASWIENTVLMPRIRDVAWAFLTDKIQSGALIIPSDERLRLCRRLSEMVNTLEDNNLSHRNLSRTSIFIDASMQSIQLIDWDEIFHPTLAIPPSRTVGTCGYIAPFVMKSGIPDPFVTWRLEADRFSLAILNSEFLSLHAGSQMAGDGGMFDQDELYDRRGEGIDRILKTLQTNFPGADTLLFRALDARSFDDCPSPAEWIAFTGGVTVPFVNAGGIVPPIQFYSCFISYSNEDKDFAQRLYSRLRDAGLRVWFAPENVKSGVKLFDQVDQAIEMHDRLLLVLSESSLHSDWVKKEIRSARRLERASGRLKLFPVRLTNFETLQQWVCTDSATAEDLAEEVRSYFIPDFSNWKSYDDFEKAFARLLDDLKPTA